MRKIRGLSNVFLFNFHLGILVEMETVWSFGLFIHEKKPLLGCLWNWILVFSWIEERRLQLTQVKLFTINYVMFCVKLFLLTSPLIPYFELKSSPLSLNMKMLNKSKFCFLPVYNGHFCWGQCKCKKYTSGHKTQNTNWLKFGMEFCFTQGKVTA